MHPKPLIIPTLPFFPDGLCSAGGIILIFNYRNCCSCCTKIYSISFFSPVQENLNQWWECKIPQYQIIIMCIFLKLEKLKHFLSMHTGKHTSIQVTRYTVVSHYSTDQQVAVMHQNTLQYANKSRGEENF